MNAVGVGASAVALTGVFGLIMISRTEHVGRDPAAATALTLRLICEGNFHLLQAVSRQTQEACATPAAHRRRGGRLYEEFGESPGPQTDGPGCLGEGDGAFEVNQGDVVVVQACTGVVERVRVLLQNIVILLGALLDAQGVLSCKFREEIIDPLKARYINNSFFFFLSPHLGNVQRCDWQHWTKIGTIRLEVRVM